MDWNLYSFVIASSYRKKLLTAILERPKTPSELKDETGYYLSHVSNTLRELTEKGLISCLTPDRSKGRVFSITDAGKEIVQYLRKHDI